MSHKIASSKKSLPDLTQGSIAKTLFRLAVPIVLANLLQTAYQLTDTFWVGRLGAEAVAAVSLSFPVFFFFMSLGGGLAIAGTILVAQYRGQGEQDQVNHVAAQTLLLMLLAAAVITVLGVVLSRPIMMGLGAAPEVLPGAVAYLRITFFGMVFLFGYFVFQSLMRGVGDVKTPFYIVLGTVLLNLVLDPLFILGYGPIPGFGVAGAAMATIGTQGIAALIGLGMLFSGRYGIHLTRKAMWFDGTLIRKMMRLGVPASLEQATRAFGLTIMSFLVAGFGTMTVAAYGIGMRMVSFVIIPAVGMSMAASTMVGQNMGAGRVDRAGKSAWIGMMWSFLLLTAAGVAFFIWAEALSTTFLPGETEAVAISTQFVRMMALSFGCMGIQQVVSGALRGAGHTQTSMLLTLATLFVFQVPSAIVLAHTLGWGPVGIWASFPISNIISVVLALVVFGRGGWKQMKGAVPVQTKIEEEVLIEEGF